MRQQMLTDVNMPSGLIRIDDKTKSRLLAQSLTHDANGDPSETMDSIIRRALTRLEQQTHVKKIDVSKL